VILVTGATSQIGRCAVDRLRESGTDVAVISRTEPKGGAVAGVTYLECDFRDPHLNFSVDFSSLLHVAGIWLLPPHIGQFHQMGLRRLVCFSSTSIYVKRGSSSGAERDLVRRTLEAEASIERQCAALGVEWTILRPTLVYGVGMDRNISRAVRFIRRFGFYPLALNATGLRQPVHAGDLAAVALRAIDEPSAAGKTYDVGGGETLAYREMIGRIFDALGMTRRFITLPFLEYAAAAAGAVLRKPEITGEMVRRMRFDLVCDNRPAFEDLDYRPRPFLSGGRADLGL